MSDSEQQKKGSCAKKSLTSGGEKKKDNKDAKTSQVRSVILCCSVEGLAAFPSAPREPSSPPR